MTDQTEDTGSERVVGTSLTTVAEYSQTAMALASLQDRFKNLVVDVSTKKGLDAATKDVAELRTLRTSLEKRRKELKEPLLARGKVLDDEAKRLTAEISALEDPLKLQVDAKNAEIEKARLEKLEAERLRVEAINKRIDEIRNTPATMVGKPAVIIQGALARLKADELREDEFQEHFVTARDAHTAAIVRIEELLQAQLEADDEKKRQAARDAEMEAMRKQMAEQQRLIDEAREREEAAERARQEAAAAEQRRIEQVERDRVAAAQREHEEADRAERERVAAEERAAREEQERIEREEADRIRAEEEARLQAERDRQAAAQRLLDEQADKLKREKVEAARKAEELRLKSLRLFDAAQAVVDYFADLSDAPKVVCDLAVALVNDGQQAKPARAKKAANA